MASTIRPMATDIRTFEELNGLTRINTVPIPVIERRARPDQQNAVGYSAGGFLAPQDRFLEVVRNDWNTVKALGLTHVEIAEHLDRIIRNSKGVAGTDNFLFSGRTTTTNYDFSEVPNNKLSNLVDEINKTKSIWTRFSEALSMRVDEVRKVSGIFNKMKAFFESIPIIFQNVFPSATVLLGIRRIQSTMGAAYVGTSGLQEDIFQTEEEERNGRMGGPVGPWRGDYTFTNILSNESVKVPTGVLEYIRRYGFYEGNVPYRADPLKLVSVLTGIRVADLEAYVRSRTTA